jgi:hypothetical protein
MTEPSFTWTKDNAACVATDKILAALLQFNGDATSFDAAGRLPMRQLTYFPKVTPDAEIIRAHASQMAWQFCDRLLKITRVREDPVTTTLGKFIGSFVELFSNSDVTLKDIAEAADGFLLFPGEKRS